MKRLLFFLACITFYSCTTYRYIYSASPANNPYFVEKGESKLAGYYSSSGNNQFTGEHGDGVDLQGAYAVGKHWAITTGYFNRREKDIYNYNSDNAFDSSIVNYKRNLFDVGGGYFTSLNKKKTIFFNLYGGMAFGKFLIEDNGQTAGANYDRFHRSHITKWYVQPSVNFITGNYFRFSLIFKTSYVHYGNIQTSYTAEEQAYYSFGKIANKTVPYFEPGINMQFGLPKLRWMKLDLSISGATHPFSSTYINSDDAIRLDTRTDNVSIGLSFDLSKTHKKN